MSALCGFFQSFHNVETTCLQYVEKVIERGRDWGIHVQGPRGRGGGGVGVGKAFKEGGVIIISRGGPKTTAGEGDGGNKKKTFF